MSGQSQQKPVVVVTGSEGLIGRRICERLGADYTIAGLDITAPHPTDAKAWFHCDFTDESSVEQAMADLEVRLGGRIASAIHLAAYYDFSGGASPLYDELTVEGTRRLLRALQRFEVVEQFIFASSLLVMKPCEPGQVLTEASPTQAEWEYPESKLRAEAVIRAEHGAIPAVALRLAGVYDDYGHSLPICQNIRRIAEKEWESYFFPGDADRGQAFVHLDDAVKSVGLAVSRRHELQPYEVFLIAEEECLSYERLQDLIGELVHGVQDWPTVRIPKIMAKTGAWAKDKLAESEEDRPFIKPWMIDMADAHYPVDNSRARERLGWAPEHRLSETLPRIASNLKRDPARWYKQNNLPLPEDVGALRDLSATN